MNCPPTKRLRGLNQEVSTAMAFDDPFGDDEDFTQDDLDEIDIIASQAITSASASKPGTTATDVGCRSAGPPPAVQGKPASRATNNHSRENMLRLSSSNRGTAGIPGREPLGEF